MNFILWIVTALLLTFSLIKSGRKTAAALVIALKKLADLLSLFLLIMIAFALVVTITPPELLQRWIGSESGIRGVIIALGLGSVAVMPGFAASPLCAALRSAGVPYYIIAAFSLSLMNIGIITFPVEKRFLGLKVAIVRNLLALPVCIIVVIVFKVVFRE